MKYGVQQLLTDGSLSYRTADKILLPPVRDSVFLRQTIFTSLLARDCKTVLADL